jgi:MtN3 and saliva related transmembrane protein
MIIQWLATITGILMSLGYYPQIWKIVKTRSAKDIAIPSYIIFSIGTLSWLCYGFYLHDITIILSFGLGMIGSWTILFLTFWYRKAK